MTTTTHNACTLPLGLNFGEDADAYHACGAIGHSSLNYLREQGPARWRAKYVSRKIEPEESDAFTFGRAFHCLILEGLAAFETRFATRPDGLSFATKEGKAWKAEQEEAGRQIIGTDEAASLADMAGSVLTNENAWELLRDTAREVTCRVEVADLVIQSRFDAWRGADSKLKLPCGWAHDGPVIIDLKTCDSLHEENRRGFHAGFHRHGYHRQAALYRLIAREYLAASGLDYFRTPLGTVPFVFIVVEKSPPYECAVFTPDPTALAIGEREVLDDLRQLRDCYLSGSWRTAPAGVSEISLPDFYASQLIED